ncbi:MAG: S-methyl-5-thioribose-1-phosphate isomerase [Nanoarchaeota archaeon]|nr:S-methyl-5-thioribose-1-phosphate isomerase [Nanoarchaeota archaeon]
MKVDGKDYRTVWMEDGIIKTINQPLLADKFEIVSLKDYREVANSISTMIIRGAPAIGAMGAYGLAQTILNENESDKDKFIENIKKIKKILWETRPTAYDLTHGLDFVFNTIIDKENIDDMKKAAEEAAEEYANLSVEACKKIGEYGNDLINDGTNILTHCNAGAIATVDYGTALAPIRIAFYNGKKIFVFVDETRPRLQGARLTAWELVNEGIPHAIIADNSAGYYMQKGEVGLVITGADRIALNGDVANKIGTYEKAVLAKENNIPFYVAAPLSTFDINTLNGDDIPIEERDEKEVLEIKGVRLAPLESSAKNPAFDVTPAKYITGIITEKGIIKANKEEIGKLKY